MENRALWIAFFFTIQFLAVLGENPFKEYFYNKYHHKGHHSSTPEEISSISGDSDTIEHSSTGHSENTIQSSTGEFEITNYSFQDNDDTSMTPPTLQFGDYNNHAYQQTTIFIIVWTVIGCFVFLSLCCGCVCFCIRGSRRNRMVYGRVVISNQPGTAATLVPPEQPALAQQRVLAQQQRQTMVIQQYLQPVTTQHHPQQQFSGGHTQNPPPHYQFHPVQQQYPTALASQTSPTQDHSHNSPESPPPVCDFPEKFE